VGSSICGGKRKERLVETTRREKSKPFNQKQISLLIIFFDEPILSRPEEWVFVLDRKIHFLKILSIFLQTHLCEGEPS